MSFRKTETAPSGLHFMIALLWRSLNSRYDPLRTQMGPSINPNPLCNFSIFVPGETSLSSAGSLRTILPTPLPAPACWPSDGAAMPAMIAKRTAKYLVTNLPSDFEISPNQSNRHIYTPEAHRGERIVWPPPRSPRGALGAVSTKAQFSRIVQTTPG